MTYWALIPAEERYKNKTPVKVIKQFRKPERVAFTEIGYMSLGFATKNYVIQYLNEIGIKNAYRPLSFKSYDFRVNTRKSSSLDSYPSSLKPQESTEN